MNLPRLFTQTFCFMVSGFTLSAQAQVTRRSDEVGALLNRWFQEDTAAGLKGITYENRDGQHSPLDAGMYPQLTLFEHTPSTGPAQGPAMAIRPQPTLGNCSMAAAADAGGSLPRLYLMTPKGGLFVANQYLTNNLMLYPEHQDHDIGSNGVGGYGDLYPANVPCWVISQGSSGTDQPFLRALLSATAAMRPETQQFILKKNALVPVLQSLLRHSYRRVKRLEDYFTSLAHPAVFDGAELDELKMVQLAHELTPESLPPMPVIEVVEETETTPGVDTFDPQQLLPTRFLDAKVAVARLFRPQVAEYGMLLNIGKTQDLLGRPIKLEFRLLQGDPGRIRIEQSGNSPYVRLRVRWHEPLRNVAGLISHRIDIGLFATAGNAVSVPAILSFYMLPNEARFFDDQGRVAEIDFQAANPDPGLPTNGQDLRWVKVITGLSEPKAKLTKELVGQMFNPEQLDAIKTAALSLNQRQKAIVTLEARPNGQASAERMRKRLQEDLQEALQTPMPGQKDRTLQQGILAAFVQVANAPGLYLEHVKFIQSLAAESPKPTAAADIEEEVSRLISLGIFSRSESGKVSIYSPKKQHPAALQHYLRGLNLIVLSQAIFPEWLERSMAPAWVDPRLSLQKPWRDVHRYDETTGQHLGWTRYQKGRSYAFNPKGQLLEDGPKKSKTAKTVQYLPDGKYLLRWE
jgi:hypothetical protein